MESIPLFGLYRILIGWHRFEEEEGEQIDWKAAERRREEYVSHYIARVSEENYDQVIRDLEIIAAQVRAIGETGTVWFNKLLSQLSEKQPLFAHKLIHHALESNSPLKHFIGFVLTGLRVSDRSAVQKYIDAWLNSNDPILWTVVAHCYELGDWNQADEEDWRTLRRLLAFGNEPVDSRLLWMAWRYAHYNPELAVETVMTIASRGSNLMLHGVAEILAFPSDNRQGWAIEFSNPDDLWIVVQNLQRLPSLDSHVEEVLNRLGATHPSRVIDFIEERIKATETRKSQEANYEPIPFQLSRATQSIRTSEEYPLILRRLLDWQLRDNVWFQLEGRQVIKEIAGMIDPTLYEVLMEWISSGDKQKVLAVAHILSEFNKETDFYNLCREIILRTDDEDILGTIMGVIRTTPEVISGPMYGFYQRLNEVTPWLNDENFRVRRFAQRVVTILRNDIERDKAQEEYEERQWHSQ